jgi:hypothetical protein
MAQQGIMIEPWVLTVFLGALSVLIGFLAYKSAKQRDTAQDRDKAMNDRDAVIREQAAMNTQIQVMIAENRATNTNVNSTMTRLEARDQETQRCLAEHGKLIAEVAASTKSAHKRLNDHLGVKNTEEA